MVTSATHLGSLPWSTLAGPPPLKVEVARPEALKDRFDLDQSHLPTDQADMSEADRLALEEKAANKKLKAFYAAGTVFDTTIRTLGNLGMFWGLIQGVLNGGVAGWQAVGAGVGSAITVTDAAFQTKSAAVNRNLPAAIDGTLTMVQGMGVMLTAVGLGRIPAMVSVAAMMGKFGYGIYRSMQDEKEKETEKKADEERKKAAQAQPAPAVPPASSAASVPSVPMASSTASDQ